MAVSDLQLQNAAKGVCLTSPNLPGALNRVPSLLLCCEWTGFVKCVRENFLWQVGWSGGYPSASRLHWQSIVWISRVPISVNTIPLRKTKPYSSRNGKNSSNHLVASYFWKWMTQQGYKSSVFVPLAQPPPHHARPSHFTAQTSESSLWSQEEAGWQDLALKSRSEISDCLFLAFSVKICAWCVWPREHLVSQWLWNSQLRLSPRQTSFVSLNADDRKEQHRFFSFLLTGVKSEVPYPSKSRFPCGAWASLAMIEMLLFLPFLNRPLPPRHTHAGTSSLLSFCPVPPVS